MINKEALQPLEKLYGTLQEWYHVVHTVGRVESAIGSLNHENGHVIKAIQFFTPTDNVTTQEALELESRAKASRAHLISRAEDQRVAALALKESLERKAIEQYAPLNFAFEGQDTVHTRMIREKFKQVYSWNRDRTALHMVELPINLPDAVEMLSGGDGKSWEGWIKHYHWNGLGPLTDVPEGEWRDMKKLHDAYCTYTLSKGKGYSISSALWVSGPNIIGSALCRPSVYAIKKEDHSFSTHLFATSRQELMQSLGTLLGKDVEDYFLPWEKIRREKEKKI
jgi:hypothetical protein